MCECTLSLAHGLAFMNTHASVPCTLYTTDRQTLNDAASTVARITVAKYVRVASTIYVCKHIL